MGSAGNWPRSSRLIDVNIWMISSPSDRDSRRGVEDNWTMLALCSRWRWDWYCNQPPSPRSSKTIRWNRRHLLYRRTTNHRTIAEDIIFYSFKLTILASDNFIVHQQLTHRAPKSSACACFGVCRLREPKRHGMQVVESLCNDWGSRSFGEVELRFYLDRKNQVLSIVTTFSTPQQNTPASSDKMVYLVSITPYHSARR